MNIKNYFKIVLLLIFVVSLGACGKDDGYTISLYNGEIEVEVIKDIDLDTNIELPILEEDGMIFIGWSNGEEIFYDEYNVSSNTELYASFEAVSDVFEYEVHFVNDRDVLYITAYTGDAIYLKIPQIIDGYVVGVIAIGTFEESNLVEVFIPVDTLISGNAFHNSTSLKEVTFYGEYLLKKETVISPIDYEEILSENPDECIIIEGSIEEGSWTFQEGCPIAEVIGISEIIVIEENEYFQYYVLVDQNHYPTHSYNIGTKAFFGASSLETIYLPKDFYWIGTSVFEGCTSLKNIVIHEDDSMNTVIDGVVYNKDVTHLIYYPPGLEGTTYEIPSTITSIRYDAFYENVYLEKIIINELFEDDFNVLGLHNLKEVIVHEDNEVFYTVDGILFKGYSLEKYPAAKTGSSYTIPLGILSIGSSAFENNKYLETIDLGISLEHIGLYAFAYSDMLTELYIPSSVTHIDGYIALNSSIKTIVINRSVIINGSITSLAPAFGHQEGDVTKIYIPDDSIDAYLEDYYWNRYSDIILSLTEYTE